MNVQWFPGHMTKALRSMKEDIKLVDLVIELLDARVPLSSRNPDLAKLCGDKKRIVLLNKSDLADSLVNRLWVDYFKSENIDAILTTASKNSGKNQIEKAINTAMEEKKAKDAKRGILNRPLRIMIVGIPNVGKSTLINSLAKKAAAKTGDKPGVTKGNQWIRVGKGAELLDTPGVLWPKFDDEQVGVKLALIGSVSDTIIDPEELACEGIKLIRQIYAGAICERYGATEEGTDYEILTDIAVKRNLIMSGAKPDTVRAAKLFLDDLRSTRLGLLSLERP